MLYHTWHLTIAHSFLSLVSNATKLAIIMINICELAKHDEVYVLYLIAFHILFVRDFNLYLFCAFLVVIIKQNVI